MGQLSCNRCGANAEGDTREQADDRIDHARGQMIGRPCAGLQSDLVWDGAKSAPKVETATELTTESDSPTKSKTKSKRR